MVDRPVSDISGFNSAVSAASGGDTISLAAGNYGELNLNGVSYGSLVTIRPSDVNNPPVCENFRAQNTDFVRFEGITFSKAGLGGKTDPMCFLEDGSTNIEVEDCLFQGIPEGTGRRRGAALRMRQGGNSSTPSCSNISILNNVFADFLSGILGNYVHDSFINGNEFYGLGSDGHTWDAIDNVEIKGNYFHDNNRTFSGEHADNCKIQRTTGFGSTDVTYENNVIDAGDGAYGQGFFGGTSGQSNTPTTRHTNLVYRNNLVYVSHVNQFELQWVDGVTAEYNTVLYVDANPTYPYGTGAASMNWGGATSCVIDSNICNAVGHSNGGEYTVTNNATVAVGGYDAYFNIIASAHTETTTGDVYNDFEIKSGSAAHTNLCGSRMMKREGGWPGTTDNIGIEPHPAYPGGFRNNVTNPTLSLTVSDPADDSTAVPVNKELTYTFSKPVQFGTGNITLRDNDGGFADLEVFSVTTDVGTGAGTISIAGNVLKVRPTSALAYSTEHALRIDPTAIDDTETSPNSFAGVADDTTLSFTTDAAPVSTPSGKRHLGSTFLGIGPFLS